MSVDPAVLHITDPHRVDEIVCWIHDSWFEIEDITFDADAAIVTIPFVGAQRLRLHQVEEWTAEDTEGIGRYDFNTIRYDDAHRRLTVLTGIPAKIVATVRGFEISLDFSGQRSISESRGRGHREDGT